MKAKQWVAILALTSLSASLLAVRGDDDENPDLSLPYQPTRAEWLQLVIHQTIKQKTDSWQTRIGFGVTMTEDAIFVTLTAANGQELVDESAADLFESMVKRDIEGVIENYPWASELNVIVHFLVFRQSAAGKASPLTPQDSQARQRRKSLVAKGLSNYEHLDPLWRSVNSRTPICEIELQRITEPSHWDAVIAVHGYSNNREIADILVGYLNVAAAGVYRTAPKSR